jgi:hypothetical protein
VAQEKVVAAKLAAQTAARAYLADLPNTIIDGLQKAGTFIEPVVKQVEQEFLPWLITRVVHELEQVDQAQFEVNDIVTRAVERMVLHYASTLPVRYLPIFLYAVYVFQ